jgi:trk system potassium uptake protein TrkA
VPTSFDVNGDATQTEETMPPNPTRYTTADSTRGDRPAEYVVLGDDHLGATIANRLHAEGREILLIHENRNPDSVPGLQGDPSDVAVMEVAGVDEASTVVVATSRDSRNFLIAQHLQSRFDVRETIVLVHTPDRCDLFADVGHEPICATSVLSEALLETIPTETQEFDQTA